MRHYNSLYLFLFISFLLSITAFPLRRYAGSCSEENLPLSDKLVYYRVVKNYFRLYCAAKNEMIHSTKYSTLEKKYFDVVCISDGWKIENKLGFLEEFSTAADVDTIQCREIKNYYSESKCPDVNLSSKDHIIYTYMSQDKYGISCLGDRKVTTKGTRNKEDSFEVKCSTETDGTFLWYKYNLEYYEKFQNNISCVKENTGVTTTETSGSINDEYCQEWNLLIRNEWIYKPLTKNYVEMHCSDGQPMNSNRYFVENSMFIGVFCEEGVWKVKNKNGEPENFVLHKVGELEKLDIQCSASQIASYCLESDLPRKNEWIYTAAADRNNVKTTEFSCLARNRRIKSKVKNSKKFFVTLKCIDRKWKTENDKGKFVHFNHYTQRKISCIDPKKSAEESICSMKILPKKSAFKYFTLKTGQLVKLTCENTNRKIAFRGGAELKSTDGNLTIKCVDERWEMAVGDKTVVVDQNLGRKFYCETSFSEGIFSIKFLFPFVCAVITLLS